MTTLPAKPRNLGTLAELINVEHEAVEANFQRGFEHAVRAGLLLLEAKAHVPHGQWLPWLSENCAVSERSAQNYMRVAKNRPDLGTESATAADLTLRGAVAALASPKETPEIETLDLHRVPSPGHCLFSSLGGDRGFVVIHPSQYEDFYWVGLLETLEPGNEESGGISTVSEKPLPPYGFGIFLRTHLRWANTFEWDEVPYNGPLEYFYAHPPRAKQHPSKAA